MPSLVPVDGNPFASGPQLIPVDHDPFAPPQASTLGYAGTRALGGFLEGAKNLASAAALEMGNSGQAEELGNLPSGEAQANQAVYGRPDVQAPNAAARYLGAIGSAAGANPVLAATAPGLTAAGSAAAQGAADLGGGPVWQTAAAAVPALLGRPSAALLNLAKSPERQAATLLRSRLEADAAAGGPTAQSIGTDLASANGVPLTLADTGGESVKGLAEKVATAPGESRQIATQFLNDRDAGAGPRLVAALDQNLSNGGDAFTTAKALMQQRAQAAAPLYDKALSAEGLSSPRLEKLLADPIMQQGFARGLEVQRLEALAQGKPFDPNSYALSFVPQAEKPTFFPPALTGRELAPGHMLEAADSPQAVPVPNMRSLDAVKRGLDDILEQYRDPTTGRLQLDQRGRAINDVRVALVNELDNLNPDYAAARQAWAGPTQSIAAMRQGQNFRNMRPEQIADQIRTMSDGEKQFFQLGAADALRQSVAKTSSGGNEALRIVGNDYVKQQLRPLFSSDAAYGNFIRAATNENRMFQTRNQMLGNSRTAMRLAEAQAGGEGGGLLGNALQAGTAMMLHEPIAGTPAFLRLGHALKEKLTGPSPEVNAAVARMLFNPALSRDALARALAAKAPARYPLAPGLLSPALLNPPQNSNGLLAP